MMQMIYTFDTRKSRKVKAMSRRSVVLDDDKSLKLLPRTRFSSVKAFCEFNQPLIFFVVNTSKKCKHVGFFEGVPYIFIYQYTHVLCKILIFQVVIWILRPGTTAEEKKTVSWSRWVLWCFPFWDCFLTQAVG